MCFARRHFFFVRIFHRSYFFWLVVILFKMKIKFIQVKSECLLLVANIDRKKQQKYCKLLMVWVQLQVESESKYQRNFSFPFWKSIKINLDNELMWKVQLNWSCIRFHIESIADLWFMVMKPETIHQILNKNVTFYFCPQNTHTDTYIYYISKGERLKSACNLLCAVCHSVRFIINGVMCAIWLGEMNEKEHVKCIETEI